MKRPYPSRVLKLLALLALAAGLSGCASDNLKGTPFYTGEYEKRVGPAEDRVNVWPLLYYRNPALSVLWPVFEFSDDRATTRPLFSLYHRQEAHREYNVLWPLAQFDRLHEQNRIFPVFWGSDYAAVFPLYWHIDNPFADRGRGLDTLFPLWIYTHPRPDDYSLHVLWPLFNRKHDGATQGGRLWPLYGDWETGGGSYYGWYAWPLGYYWGKHDVHSRLMLPLFYQNSEPGASSFYTLITGRHNEPAQTWSYVFPLYLYERSRDQSTRFYSLLAGQRRQADGDRFWYALPALAWGSESGGNHSTWIGGPLYHSSETRGASYSHLFPLYYRARTPDTSTFVSLLAGRHQDPGESWSYVAPLWFTRTDADTESSWYSLLGGKRRETNGDRFWYFTPTLTWSWNERNRSELLVGGPLFHSYRAADHHTTHLFPLYYYSQIGDKTELFSLPWSRLRSPSKSWTLAPPVWFDYDDPAGAFTVTPFYLQGLDKKSGETWSAIPPVYYHRNLEKGDTFLSPLYNSWSDSEGGRSTLVPPALTYYHRAAERTDLWALAGLGHWSWGEHPGSSHLLPLYYRNSASDVTLSPLYCSWPGADKKSSSLLIPPALSLVHRSESRTDLWALAGLGRLSWGEQPGASYLLPLVYRNPSSDTTLSPLYCKWSNPAQHTETTLLPPLLSWVQKEPGNHTLYALLGLGKFNWGPEAEESHLFPIYYRDPVNDSFLSLPWARWQEAERTYSAMPLLLSWFSRDRTDRDLRLLLGLFGQSWSDKPDTPSTGWLVPLYLYGADYWLTLPAGKWQADATAFHYFPTPLVGWRTGATSGSWVLPLYWYRNDPATGARDLWYLPWGGYHARNGRAESSLFPIYGYENDGPVSDVADPAEAGQTRGVAWHVLVLAGYSNKQAPLLAYDSASHSNLCQGVEWTAKSRLFPLWWYERNRRTGPDRLEKEFNLLFFLQDYWRKADLGPEPKEDYTRTRILWRFLHYERDHNTVSLDVFPAITYDRDGAAKRKVSFLWRGFRYERKDGQKAVDLLFLPVWRTSWAE